MRTLINYTGPEIKFPITIIFAITGLEIKTKKNKFLNFKLLSLSYLLYGWNYYLLDGWNYYYYYYYYYLVRSSMILDNVQFLDKVRNHMGLVRKRVHTWF
jgi:hypothetical protein